MSCKQLKASDNRLQKMSNISINQCMQLLHVLELEKAACQPSALWISSASCNFIGADEYAWWPGVGHEAVANKRHGKEVPRAAGFRQEARNGHGMQHGMSGVQRVEREVRERRCVVCSVAEGCFVRVRTEFVTASQSQRSIRLRAPPQGRWHIVTVKQSRGSAAMTCNGYWPI